MLSVSLPWPHFGARWRGLIDHLTPKPHNWVEALGSTQDIPRCHFGSTYAHERQQVEDGDIDKEANGLRIWYRCSVILKPCPHEVKHASDSVIFSPFRSRLQNNQPLRFKRMKTYRHKLEHAQTQGEQVDTLPHRHGKYSGSQLATGFHAILFSCLMSPPAFDATLVTPNAVAEAYKRLPPA